MKKFLGGEPRTGRDYKRLGNDVDDYDHELCWNAFESYTPELRCIY